MSYDPKLDAMMALAVAMSTGNPSEGLEVAETREQRSAHRNLMLPKEMTPSKEAFEAFGFIFEDIDDDVLYKATLPDGWKLDSEGGYWTYIIDDKGRKRGSSFYKGAFYDRKGSMSLYPRFQVTCIATDPESRKGPFTVSVKDADDTILFTAGECDEAYSDECRELMNKAEDYLKSNYPAWKDPTKYWD